MRFYCCRCAFSAPQLSQFVEHWRRGHRNLANRPKKLVNEKREA